MKTSNTMPDRQKTKITMGGEIDKLAFYRKAREMYQKDVDADRHNIEPAREDMQFVIGDQWDVHTRTRRQRLKKPTLTVNRLPAFIAQYLGSWQQTDQTMKLLPVKGGSKAVAEIRQGLMRTVVRTPIAKHAQYTAMESAYICGVGNFGLELIDAKYDFFAKDFQLVPHDDPFSVVWDRSSREPTGSDAGHCYVMEYLTKDDFKLRYPDATDEGGWSGDELDYTTMTAHGWEVDEMIRICYFWQMKEEPCTLAVEMMTGDIIDVTDESEQFIKENVEMDNEGEHMIRETTRPYAECYVLGGKEVLEGPFRLNISRLPVFRVEGWALQEASVRFRWGFVRNAKDPQRLHNYWRSILAEELMKSPASKWLLDQAAMKSGLADAFRNAHLSGDNVLFWDSQSDGAKPEFIPAPMMNQAVLTEAQMSVQDIKDVTNKHEASLGVTSNEVSGKAINARQRVSELGDRIYLENMNMALAECARVMNELIPEVYDTRRTIMITGETDQVLLQEINGDMGDSTPDITKGKYELTYTTGPSYATKREEATETLLTLMNHMPQTGNLIADIIARNMDIPGSEEIATRLMMMLPPGVADMDHLPERQKLKLQAMMERQEQAAAENAQKEQAVFMAGMKKQAAEIEELLARARKQVAGAAKDESEVGVQRDKVEYDYELGDELNVIKAMEAGIKLDKNQTDAASKGMEAAFKVEDQRIAREQPNGSENSQGGNEGSQNDE